MCGFRLPPLSNCVSFSGFLRDVDFWFSTNIHGVNDPRVGSVLTILFAWLGSALLPKLRKVPLSFALFEVNTVQYKLLLRLLDP